jgi:hypothetical protein
MRPRAKHVAFLVAFFGSLGALIHSEADDRVVLAWFLLFTAWAIALRWWMVAGTLLGLFFGPVVQRAIDVAGTVFHVIAGAYFGFFFGYIWDMRPEKGARRDG